MIRTCLVRFFLQYPDKPISVFVQDSYTLENISIYFTAVNPDSTVIIEKNALQYTSVSDIRLRRGHDF